MSSISEKIIPTREPRADKVEQVSQIADLVNRSSGLILTDYRGLTVAEKAELTRRLREVGAEYHVVKNTLFRRAYGDRSALPEDALAGPTAVAFALDEPTPPAKVVLDFIREKRKMAVKGGVVEGQYFDPDGVQTLSQLPPKQVLLGEVVGAIQGPLSNLVYTLDGVLSEFVRTIQALHEKKAEAEA
ncbi:MAG: 50S ribosomal protein L10 [Armatimonadetes bacterium]|nr:50S ribosomal protein L10 [Armatimonadota bacterium]